MNQYAWTPMEFSGIAPFASFGHTATPISKTRVVLFGGATGESNKYVMTDAVYVFYLFKKTWSKIECKNFSKFLASGSKPNPRAAHAATAVDGNKMVVYGGASGSKMLPHKE